METKVVKINGYEINMVKTDKFRTIEVIISYKRKVEVEKLSLYLLLLDLVHLGNNKYKTEKEFTKRRHENYGQAVNTHVKRKGKEINFDFSTNFIAPGLVEEAKLEDFLDFFLDSIYCQGREGAFTETNFKRVYNELASDIKSVKDRPGEYAYQRLLEVSDPNEIYNLPNYGREEDFKFATLDKVVELYDEILNDSYIDITVVGDIDFEEITKYFKNKIKRENQETSFEYYMKPNSKKKHIEFVEPFTTNQSILKMIFSVDGIETKEDRAKMKVLNTILGGSTDSKLFKNVREKHSLCYSVGSLFRDVNSSIIVSSGINKENFELAKKIILEQIESMKGEITEEELNGAKNYLIDSFYGSNDNIRRVANNASDKKFLNNLDGEEYTNLIKSVTIEEINKLSNRIKLDTIYLLEGGKNEKTN